MADIFDVLADGTRREILRQLLESRGELAVGDLVTELGIAQPTVSKHLKALREAGLVTVRPEAQRRWYQLRSEPLQELDAWLEPYRRTWSGRLDDLGRHLDEQATCQAAGQAGGRSASDHA